MPDASQPYDLTSLEDLFACVEILTRARMAVLDTDASLAADLGKLTHTMMAFAEADTGHPGLEPPARRRSGPPADEAGLPRWAPDDSSPPPRSAPGRSKSQGQVVDILTGQVVCSL
ncbi:MAG: hypothetical protein AB1634_13930 [Thermodesulfobacteriota bacterium]